MRELTKRGREMLGLLRRHEAGEDLSALAAEAGIARSTLAWWRSKLREEIGGRPVEFVELRLEDQPRPEPMLVHIGEASIEIPRGFDADELGRLVTVLRSC